MKSKLVPFISGAMLVLGVGLLVANSNKMEKMMKDLSSKATQIANKFKGKMKNCECMTNCCDNSETSQN
ncbi:MAG: hypothetical protein IJX78_06435 [Bacilli bacterium]|nr:hypothetical protein [Bacilli bacterium]